MPIGDFRNEPLAELRSASERARLAAALTQLDRAGPVEVPVIIGTDRRADPGLDSVDPGMPSRVVARATVATLADVDGAVAAATQAGRGWATMRAVDRAAALHAAANRLRERRDELTALAVRECAKPWAEADADVCEAIDFLDYYADQAVALDAGPPLIQLPGERNTLHYRARGVTAVIAPWNFPLAIFCGMTSAALATGNAVCLKPAEQSPACGLAIVEALLHGGVPPGVINLLPGEGEVGALLVAHRGIQTIAFTGSGAVGLQILRSAAVLADGQRHIKRVVAEMGGKNCLIVDADADLDDVVPAVMSSAFGFAGQKCSATSRVLAHERVAPVLAERLTGALQTILVGQADTFGVDVPPVIEHASVERANAILAEATDADPSRVHQVADMPTGDGFFVAPTLVVDPERDARVVCEEIFGPVVTLETVQSVDEACDLVDAQAHALTGGLFSRNPRTVSAVSRRTPVGNLYVNRGTTGAMVGRQPFGGNRLSGTGTKAGGPDYLLSYVEPVVVTENTVRHGISM